MDLYVVYREGSNWTDPINLGPKINSQGDEISPFLQGKTLYFSPNWHSGFGGYDIFKSTLLENNKWSEPTNLGIPLNTPGDEVFYQLSADGSTGYMSSYRKDGFGDKDIYRVKFSNEKTTPSNLVLLKGIVTDAETGNGVYINPDCVKMVRDFRNVTKIMFLDDGVLS